ncbi:helix-turn-helix domain-containing protein [Pedococcus sp. P5_B7]
MSEERLEAGRVLLGAALRQRRLDAGLTLSELAERAGLSLSYLSEVERGRKLMSLEALDAYALALGMLVVDILARVYPFGLGERPAEVQVVRDARFRHEPDDQNAGSMTTVSADATAGPRCRSSARRT